MIQKDDHIEISGVVKSTSTGSFTLSLEEIFVDEEWRKFSPAKTLEITEADYDTSLTPQELEFVKVLADIKSGGNYTPDQRVLAKSILTKLTKGV